MLFRVYVCIHAGSLALVSSDKLLEVPAATLPARAERPGQTQQRGPHEARLGGSNAAKALLAALEVERGEDTAGGADRDELRDAP